MRYEKRRNRKIFSIKFLILMIVLGFGIIPVKAESTGAQVSTISGITFYQDKSAPVKDPGTHSIIKHFPQTGEIGHSYALIGLILIICVFFIFIILKRREKNEK